MGRTGWLHKTNAVTLNLASMLHRAYPQVLMSMLMMVPLLCMLTLRQGEPLPDQQQQQQQQTANRQVSLPNPITIPLEDRSVHVASSTHQTFHNF